MSITYILNVLAEVLSSKIILNTNNEATTLVWDEVPKATSYTLYWDNETGVNADFYFNKLDISENQAVLQNLDNGNYYFILIADCGDIPSNPNTELKFSVLNIEPEYDAGLQEVIPNKIIPKVLTNTIHTVKSETSIHRTTLQGINISDIRINVIRIDEIDY